MVEEILEGLLALEVELGVVGPDILADFECDEVVEGGGFALDYLERGHGGWGVRKGGGGGRRGGGRGEEGEGIGGVWRANERVIGGEIGRSEDVHACWEWDDGVCGLDHRWDLPMYRARLTRRRLVANQYSVFRWRSTRPSSMPGVCGNVMYTIWSRMWAGRSGSVGGVRRCAGKGGGARDWGLRYGGGGGGCIRFSSIIIGTVYWRVGSYKLIWVINSDHSTGGYSGIQDVCCGFLAAFLFL